MGIQPVATDRPMPGHRLGARLHGTWLPAATAALLVLLLGPSPRALQSVDVDTDGDGLPDALEAVLKTDPQKADNDGDSVPDGVEHILYADPTDPADTPAIVPGFRLSYYVSASMIRFHYGFVSPLGVADVRDFRMAWSILPGGQPPGVSFDMTTAMIPLTDWFYAGSYQGATVLAFAQGIPDQAIANFTPMGVGGVAVFDGGGSPQTLLQADDIIEVDDGYVMLFSGAQSQQGSGAPGLPLNPEFPPPPGWVQDQACVTGLMPLSSGNGSINYEVTSASCQGLTDGACNSSSCSGKIGSAVSMVDPVWLAGLVGG